MSESSAVLGIDENLVATFATAQGPQQRPLGVVLTNSGVIPRAGPHRMNVHLARRLAALGFPSVRFDMSGLGDSRRASGRLSTLEQWVTDTRSAMDAAQARLGVGEFVMVGFCSGAEVAHCTALIDPRLRGLVLWDSFSYPTWQSQWRALLHRARRKGVAGLAGSVVHVIGSKLARSGARGSALHELVWQGDSHSMPTLAEYAGRLRTLAEQGVRILVLNSGGEPLFYNHPAQFAQTVGRDGLMDRLDFRYLHKADHLLTRPESQREFIDTVLEWLLQTRFPLASAGTKPIPLQAP